MKVYINVYHVNKNKIIPSNDPFLMKWSKLQNLIPEEVIDSLPRSSASRVWIMVWRFWSDPPNVRFHSPYWSILSFLFKWSMILRTTDPCSSDFYLRSHSDPKTDPNLIPQYLRITGPFDVRSNLILPLIPEYFKNLILEWFLAMILNSPDPDLIFIPKANYHRIRIFAPEKYSGFSMHSVDLWLFYFWSLNPESWHIQLPECDPENYSRIMNAFHGSVFFIGSLIPGSSQIQLLLINAWFYDHPSWMPPEGVNLGGQHKKSQESMLTHINQSLAIQLFDFKLLMDNISMYMLSYFKRSWHKVNYFL